MASHEGREAEGELTGLAARMHLDALQNADWEGAADLAKFVESRVVEGNPR